MTRYTPELYERLRNSYYKGNDIQYIPFEDFDIARRLKGQDGKRFKDHIAPDVESLFKNKDIKSSAIRFADLFIANLLDGYRRSIHHGVELAIEKDSKKSIQRKARKISETTVEVVIDHLVDRKLIKKEDAFRVRIPKEHGAVRDAILAKHGIENKPYVDEWKLIRSTAWIATDKLQKLMTDIETPKRCSRCGDIKDLSMFPLNESVCKKCRANRKKELRIKKKIESNQK